MKPLLLLSLLATLLLTQLKAQSFEGKVVYKPFEVTEDPDEIVPEDSVVLWIKGEQVRATSYMGGRPLMDILYTQSKLYEIDHAQKTIREKTHLLKRQQTQYRLQKKTGKLYLDNALNTYFVKVDSTIQMKVQVYPLVTTTQPYLLTYCQNVKGVYATEVLNKQAMSVADVIFMRPKGYQSGSIIPAEEDILLPETPLDATP
ncbi:MAG: hypothetical protein ACFB0B_03375 [Thermonemataceae bacterium]